MEITLLQKRPLSKRKFVLTDDSIIAEYITIRDKNRYEVKLENLGRKIEYEAENTAVGKILLGITISITIVCAVMCFTSKDKVPYIFNFLFAGLCSLGNYFHPHKDDIMLKGGRETLKFHRTVPTEAETMAFICEVQLRIKHILKEKYSSYNSTTSKEYYYKCINWLLDEEIIDFAEFETLKAGFDNWYGHEHFWNFIAN